MASVNNWLGFSLSPQEIPSQDHHHHQQQQQHHGHGDCFDLTSADSSMLPSLNLPPAPFGILEAFKTNNHPSSQDWNWKEVNTSYKNGMPTSCNSTLENENPPKLENFLGGRSFNTSEQTAQANGTIGLSMIKNWLRNNPSSANDLHHHHQQQQQQYFNAAPETVNFSGSTQNLSLSMSTGSQSASALPLLTGSSDGDNGGGGGGAGGDQMSSSTVSDTNIKQSSVDAVEAVPRKSIETFGQRTSIYRGVTRHRWTGRYEAHLWDNSCRREGQTRKGRQVYLGGYDKEDKAARSYDLAALKYWGTTTTTNFPISNYEKEIEEMKHMTRQEYVASLRRKSSGFSRGASIYRGVTRHHQHGRWQARIGRVAGNKDLYLGTFSTQEEAAEAYDIAAIKFRGLNAVTNFEINRYDVKTILESSTLPIGGAAKRLKDAEQAAELALLESAQRANLSNHQNHQQLIASSVTDHGIMNGYAGWPTIAFQQSQPALPSTMHYHPYGQQQQQQRQWYCKQETIDPSDTYQDFHTLQVGNTHNFLQQPSQNHVLHNLMSLDNSSFGDNASYNQGFGLLPMGSPVITDNQQEFGNVYGNGNGNGTTTSDHHQYQPYQTRNLYSTSPLKAGGHVYDHQSSSSSSWVPTAVPAVCHGASTFTVWNDT